MVLYSIGIICNGAMIVPGCKPGTRNCFVQASCTSGSNSIPREAVPFEGLNQDAMVDGILIILLLKLGISDDALGVSL